MDKLLVITGPTATGKTSLGIELAKKFDGEIISADSRQVYKFMDIGTGKDREEYLRNRIKVWGIDLVDPDYSFNVSDYVKYATAKIEDIQKRNKLPIIVGGTALYIKALLEPFETIGVPPNVQLRSEFQKYSLEALQEKLKKKDQNKWQKMNQSDRKNPRRLIRAIEIFLSRHSGEELATTPESLSLNKKAILDAARMTRDILLISLSASYGFLYPRIDKRVDDRIKQGAVQEVQNLLSLGYTFALPSMTASGYKEFKDSNYVQQWKFDEHAYARRQVSFINKFFKQKTHQFDIEKPNWQSEVLNRVRQWYSSTDDPKEDKTGHRLAKEEI